MTQPTRQVQQARTSNPKSPIAADNDEDDDDEEDEEGKEDSQYDVIDGQYNPDDYANLSVNQEVKDLFAYITRFKATEVELDSALKSFVPEFIPAIGEMDSFLKVSRPDGQPDQLGFKTLDEPAAAQTDPTVLELQLRAISKKQQYGDVVVRSIENAAKNTTAIDKWIGSISDLHRSKPPPQVNYKRIMPDIEA
jgi:intraflagellar transport protein 46